MVWFYLCIAIVAEVVATTALKSSEGFTRLAPSLIVVTGYVIAFYFLSVTVKVIPVGIIYAIWSGIGIVLVSLVAYFVLNQKLDFPAIVGIFFIILGVFIINFFSKSVAH